MIINLLFLGLAAALRVESFLLRREEYPLLVKLLGWLLGGTAVWLALLGLEIWPPFYPVLLLAIPLAALFARGDRRPWTILLQDLLLTFFCSLLALPRPDLLLWGALLLLLPAAGLLLDLLLRRLDQRLPLRRLVFLIPLALLLFVFLPPVNDTMRRLAQQRMLPLLLHLPSLADEQETPLEVFIPEGDLSFADITATAGTGGPTGDGETGGHGVMWADVTMNGLADLYITMNWRQPMADLFFANLGGGRFADEATPRGIADFDGGSHGACFADLDNDGDYDLYNGVTSGAGEKTAVNTLYRNDEGMFAPLPTGDFPALPTRAVLCFDMDGDGDLDLFAVTNYQGSADPADERNELYRNEGNWQFSPVTSGALPTAPAGQGAIDTDFDGDGDIDVLAANRTGPVNILRNDGDGRFTLVDPEQLNIRHRAEDGITTADVDNDGDLDLLLTGDEVGHLYLNNGDGTFTYSRQFNRTAGYMGGFADLDNDGDLDLVFAGDELIYLNQGGLPGGETGQFAAGPFLPLSGIDDPRAIAFADIDDDGDLDFAIGAKRSPNRLLQNQYDQGNWLKVQLISPQGQAGAFGAKLFVYAAGQAGNPQGLLALREARSNSGYLAQDEPVLHVGLGTETAVDLVVRFLDGSEVTQQGVVGGQTVLIDGRDRGGEARLFLPLVGKQWAPYLEWQLTHPDYTGNPFDLVATATFVHEETGAAHTTGMFYAGEDSWKFRFSGTLPGVWNFTTSSSEVALDGYAGRAVIAANPGVAGFVTHSGNKWMRTGLNRAFVPQFVMIGGPQSYFNNPTEIEANIQTFFVEHGFNGMHTPVFCRWFDINEQSCSRLNVADPNPDPRTFAALEALITEIHAAGGVVHIWMWGDDSRGENPGRWGLNGPADKRLQRYIAARLGPLPGWTMGYGYDLFEWVTGPELTEWHETMHAHLGWPHYLGARASKNQLDQLSEMMDYVSYEQHRPDYEMYVRTIEERPTKPAFSEDRFRIRDEGRAKDYTMELTRRGLWDSTMAGGVANIWGNLIGAPLANNSLTTSAPYPNPEMILTYAAFWEDRFWVDMVRCNSLTDHLCLQRPTNAQYVFYGEDAAAVRLDLSEMAGAQPAVAVDTRLSYVEIELGMLEPGEQVWQAPYSSDWAVAVGDFTIPQP